MNRRTTHRWSTLTGVVTATAICTTALAYGRSNTAVSVAVSTFVIAVALTPLYDPQPRRTFDVMEITIKRVAVACFVLLGIGTLGVVSVPPVSTVTALGGVLIITVPLLISVLRRWTNTQRYLVVGDDPSLLTETIRSLPEEPVGFVSPILTRSVADVHGADQTQSVEEPTTPERAREEITATDGGTTPRRVDALVGVDRLSGLSRLDHVLKERSIDTVALAFDESDRQECFGVLRVCHDNGVDVLARGEIDHAVLEADRVGNLIAVDIEPWAWYSRLAKRAFDIAFATVGLLLFSPLIVVLSLAIKLDSPGPVLYGQRRTAELGATFPVWKFRTMLPESEDARPGDDEDRITRVGRILRQSHMDEIPQLLSILVGDMSVVGPRAVWTDEESVLMREVDGWPKRWAITPGLTGLAQIRGVDSTDGEGKLECDLEYIRRQSLGLDVWIVAMQIWGVLRNCIGMLSPSNGS